MGTINSNTSESFEKKKQIMRVISNDSEKRIILMTTNNTNSSKARISIRNVKRTCNST